MTQLSDLFDVDLFYKNISEGWITERKHPDDASLRIYKYSKLVQVQKKWDPTTLNSRGLIVRNSEVLYRGIPKFFNHTESESSGILTPQTQNIVVSDKMDGSCGILYLAPDEFPSIATLSSFTSDQALHATNLIRTKYLQQSLKMLEQDGITHIFEIIY